MQSSSRAFSLIEMLMVVAILLVLLMILAPGIERGEMLANTARSRADFRALAMAIEAYRVDFQGLPAASLSLQGLPWWAGANDSPELARQDPARRVPTFRRFSPPRHGALALTTPLAYLSRLPRDPFADTPGLVMTYAYAGDRWQPQNFVLRCYGPDRDQRPAGNSLIQPSYLTYAIPFYYGGDMPLDPFNSLFVAPWFHQPEAGCSRLMIELTYDPTNGIRSNGDLFYTR